MNPKFTSSSLCWRCRWSIFGFKNSALWSKDSYISDGITRRHSSNQAAQHELSEDRRHIYPRPPFRWPSTASKDEGHSSSRIPFKWPSSDRHLRAKNSTSPAGSASAFVNRAGYKPPPVINPDQTQTYFESNVNDWINDLPTTERAISFGIPREDVEPLLKAFASAVQSGSLSTPENMKYYDVKRFGQTLSHVSSISVIYSTIFFSWAAHPSQRQILEKEYGVQSSSLNHIVRLTEATNRLFLAERYAHARRFHRKVIMHVGPTNSGKTHHALRALAAAKVGVYAGPLRLLAHEIWERLNLGQIVPLGVEEPPIKNEAEPNSLFDDTAEKPAVRSIGNPKYARVCNMLTGEEQKVVDDAASLLSCTVEMLSFSKPYDVAVVDEIQMISDPHRGFGWTSAVLGLSAKELHLCGEEAAVPIVEALLENTGDELIVNRYQRLTPLAVEDQTLNGDFSKVQKGDCIVTFSRSGIFAIKRQVEELTGLRCAVVYGRLPPEIRSEQAALFNDPDSGYDVLIGSDAIGMGLNLKIRRVIFETVTKSHGSSNHHHLSFSQVKQIAGRAGRFGLQKSFESGGFTTTLHEVDLPFLRSAISSSFASLPYARLGYDPNSFNQLFNILPPNTSTLTILEAHSYIGRLPCFVRYAEISDGGSSACSFIDEHGGQLTNRERVLYLHAPITWRDALVVEVFKNFLEQQRNQLAVHFLPAIRSTRFTETMEAVETAMEQERSPHSTAYNLSTLESFHKSVVLYIWLSYRLPVVYPQVKEVLDLKQRLEKVLEWALEGISYTAHLKGLGTQKYQSRQSTKSHIAYHSRKHRAQSSVAQAVS